MEIKVDLINKRNSNCILSDTFFYELPESFNRADLISVDMVLLFEDYPGGYVIEKRILDSNNNLLLKVKSSDV